MPADELTAANEEPVHECPNCGHRFRLREEDIVDVSFEMNATMPLLVAVLRCPACGHQWNDAREPHRVEPPQAHHRCAAPFLFHVDHAPPMENRMAA